MSALGQKRTSNILRSGVAGLALYRFVGFGHVRPLFEDTWATIMPRGAVSRGGKARLKTS